MPKGVEARKNRFKEASAYLKGDACKLQIQYAHNGPGPKLEVFPSKPTNTFLP
jgi:hypothetical protein